VRATTGVLIAPTTATIAVAFMRGSARGEASHRQEAQPIRSATQRARSSSLSSRAATASRTVTASLESGDVHERPLRATNSRRHRYAVRLFPSGSGWFRINREQRTAAFVSNSGYCSTPK
jgi:hypothetical protein